MALTATLAGGGYAAGHMTVPAAQNAPRVCYVMNGDQGPETGTLAQHNATSPSGDAGQFNDGIERVCTDGTWVPVRDYGTAR